MRLLLFDRSVLLGSSLPIMSTLIHILLTTLLKLVVLLGIALVAPRLGSRLWRAVERPLRYITRSSGLTVVLIGLLGCLTAGAMSLLLGEPAPNVHDEFSDLLAADTFVHGRLTNPTPPMWVHFETFHVIMRPTYMTKYPPGQGIALALGQVLTGHPIVGIWLMNGLACASLCWMLQVWLPKRWAGLGGLIGTVHPLLLVWSHRYWGGTIALIGGCLVIGVLRLIVERARRRDGLILGVGLSILAVSRPYEGLLLTLLLVGGMFPILRRMSPGERMARLRRAGPICTVILVLLAWSLAAYNQAVTGSFRHLPYMAYQEQYDPIPLFLTQSPLPIPVYHQKVMRNFYLDLEQRYYLPLRTLKGFLTNRSNYMGTAIREHIRSLVLIVPFVCLLLTIRKDRWMRAALIALGLFLLLELNSVWLDARYMAPASGIFFLLFMAGLRRLSAYRQRGKPIGRTVTFTLLLIWIVPSIGEFLVQEIHSPWRTIGPNQQRARIAAQLAHTAGEHLILVSYSPNYTGANGWVYNGADIDHAKVVWAWDMGPVANQELLRYFAGRHVWTLQADAKLPTPTPYTDPKANGH